MTERFAERISRLSESQRRKLQVELQALAKETHAQLIAYVESNGEVPFDIGDVRHHAATMLPKHLQPNLYVEVESIPKLPNGKIDRNKLVSAKRVNREPATPPDERAVVVEPEAVTDGLATLWSETLRADYVLPDDNFFELGGHSLLGVQLLLDVKEKFGVDIPLADLFDAPLLRDMHDRIVRQTSSSRIVATIQSGGAETPIFVIHGEGKRLADAFGPERPIYHVFDSISTSSADMSSIESIADGYFRGIREIQAEGPYFLCGHSIGGMIAYEIACRLSCDGKEVGLVAMVDSTPPGIDNHGLSLRLHGLLTRIRNRKGFRGKLNVFWQSLSRPFSRLTGSRIDSPTPERDRHEDIGVANVKRYWDVGIVYDYSQSRFDCAVYVPEYGRLWLKFLRAKWESVVHGNLYFSYVEGAKDHADMSRPPFDANQAKSYADRVKSVEQQLNAKKGRRD